MALSRKQNIMTDEIRNRIAERQLQSAYAERPAYQRNDYLGWIGRAKRDETRLKRIDQMLTELEMGHTYMKMDWSPRD